MTKFPALPASDISIEKELDKEYYPAMKPWNKEQGNADQGKNVIASPAD